MRTLSSTERTWPYCELCVLLVARQHRIGREQRRSMRCQDGLIPVFPPMAEKTLPGFVLESTIGIRELVLKRA
jgi:hypothetical protein